MDPTLITASYASIVGLVCNFVAGRDQERAAEVSEFLEWLIRHGHEETRRLIESNHATTTSLKAILNSGQGEILARLTEIERSLIALSQAYPGFSDLAASLHPDAGLSDQACDILKAFERVGAGRALESNTYDGKSLIFLDGADSDRFVPTDFRFYEADIKSLISMGLLHLEYNPKGARIFSLTRHAAKLAAYLISNGVKK